MSVAILAEWFSGEEARVSCGRQGCVDFYNTHSDKLSAIMKADEQVCRVHCEALGLVEVKNEQPRTFWCDHCQLSDCVVDDKNSDMVCMHCFRCVQVQRGHNADYPVNQVSLKDHTRVVMVQRHRYKRTNYFRNVMRSFCGAPTQFDEKTQSFVNEHMGERLTLHELRQLLSRAGLPHMIPKAVQVLAVVNPDFNPPRLSSGEMMLLEGDFKAVSIAFANVERTNYKSLGGYQSILERLCKRRGIHIDLSIIKPPKCASTVRKQQKLWETICRYWGWEAQELGGNPSEESPASHRRTPARASPEA